MDGEAVLRWCRTRPGASEELPFGPDTRVFKVGGRMFALCPAAGTPKLVSLKCDPRFAEHLRATQAGVSAAYHMPKRHWNSVALDGTVPGELVEDLLGHSYSLVVASLPRRLRDDLLAAAPPSTEEEA